jgi:protease-4
VALVHAAGDIVEGKEDDSLTAAAQRITGDDFADAIREATKAKDVRAILLRIDSPGGSAIASDQILDALKKAHAAGKPIVVSMGSLAASGGYYIAMAADKIVAHPATLTGSIGVLWGKVAFGDSLQSLAGVNAAEIGIGQNALLLSGLHPWTAEQLTEVNEQADLVYNDFTRKVAEGRHLPLEKVLEVARGRVWTGADAKERGLVDELGGFWTAVDAVKELAKIPAETKVAFRDYPQQEGWAARVSDVFDSSAETFAAIRGLEAVLGSAPVRAMIEAVKAPDGRAQLRAVDLPGE